MDRETAEVDVEVLIARDHLDAVLLRHDNTGEEAWVPLSLIEDGDEIEEGESYTVEIALWKLEALGWA